jgi:membrane-associated protease RseP (regulator of RpoE activity)
MKNTLFLIIGFFLISLTSFSQEETKKVIIIKKVKDDSGKISTEKKEASGIEADKLIEELKKDGTLDGIDIEVEIEKAIEESKKGTKSTTVTSSEDIKVEKTMVDGKEATTYTITTNEGGNKEVMVWAGEGELPAEMAKKIKENKMKEINTEGGQEMIFIGDDGSTEVMKEIRVEVSSPNKVSLGVMINDDQGVTVEEVVNESAAKKAEIEPGDIILKIDDAYTFNSNMLIKALSKFDIGDKCKITYIRNGEEKTVDVSF